jgi:hypothetical protein
LTHNKLEAFAVATMAAFGVWWVESQYPDEIGPQKRWAVNLDGLCEPREVRWCERGAGEGIRTLDMQLGKLPLYRLSYSRPMAHVTAQIQDSTVNEMPQAWLAAFLVGRDGFEPSYAMRTDLQSVSFNHSDTCPGA